MTTTTSFNFSGTNITMIATPVKKKVEEDTDASYMEMLDEFICDQKEKCSNDLSCIGCYPQEDDHQHQGSAMSNLLFGEEEEDYCGCLGEEGSGVCDDCDCGDEMEELNGVKANPVEPPLMVWDGNIKQSKVVFEMGGEPIKELKMPYTTMKDVMIAEGYKFVNGKGDKCFCDDCDNYGEVKWTAMEAFVCRDCAKTIMRNVKKFTDQW